MVKFSECFLVKDITEASPSRSYSSPSVHKYRDLNLNYQWYKGTENDFGIALKVNVPSFYRYVQLTYSVWVEKTSDQSQIILIPQKRYVHDDGREYGAGGKDLRTCRISTSRLMNECVKKLTVSTIDKTTSQKVLLENEPCVQIWFEIAEFSSEFDKDKILSKFLVSSELNKIVLDSEKAYKEYLDHDTHFRSIESKANRLERSFATIKTQLAELKVAVEKLENAEIEEQKTCAAKTEKLAEIRAQNTAKVKELDKQNLVQSLLRMDPLTVEIFQFDPETLNNISEGILRVQKDLVGRFVSLSLGQTVHKTVTQTMPQTIPENVPVDSAEQLPENSQKNQPSYRDILASKLNNLADQSSGLPTKTIQKAIQKENNKKTKRQIKRQAWHEVVHDLMAIDCSF